MKIHAAGTEMMLDEIRAKLTEGRAGREPQSVDQIARII